MTAPADLVERLATHRTLRGAPRSELEWLASHGALRRYDVGEMVLRRGDETLEMAIVFVGVATTSVERGTGRRHLLENQAGDVGGFLPFSRGVISVGDVVIVEPVEALFVHRDQFPEMIRECPKVIEILVHVMIDRTRQFSSTTWQDEKILSLGRLAAGLAHELNNPASAAFRSAELLDEALTQLSETARSLGGAHLSDAQMETATRLRDRTLTPPTTGVFSAIERSDREDEIASWLEAHHADTAPAAALAESGATTDVLDDLVGDLDPVTLDAVLHWVASEFTTRSLTIDVRRASRRIHDLVSSVKRFTYLDRTASAATDVGQGVTDTIAVLAHKAKAKSVGIKLDIPPTLPRIPGFAGELNQVWSNLLENALDAVPDGGEVAVSVRVEGEAMVVRVVDNGPGISPDVQLRMFDPFFTTKPIGQGSGLGLDIALRIVRGHSGEIVVDSRPGRTELRVALPLEGTTPAASRVTQ